MCPLPKFSKWSWSQGHTRPINHADPRRANTHTHTHRECEWASTICECGHSTHIILCKVPREKSAMWLKAYTRDRIHAPLASRGHQTTPRTIHRSFARSLAPHSIEQVRQVLLIFNKRHVGSQHKHSHKAQGANNAGVNIHRACDYSASQNQCEWILCKYYY